MSSIPSLWPDFGGVEDFVTPAEILRKQASALTNSTHGKIRGEVVTTSVGEELVHHFELVAPLLDNYRYRLFEVQHGVMAYPVAISGFELVPGERSYTAQNEQEFLRLLGDILRHDDTVNVVRSLLASSRR